MLPSWSGRKSFSTSYYYNELNGHLKDIGLFNPPRDNAKKLEPLKPGRQKTAEIAPHGRRVSGGATAVASFASINLTN
jgi:hypothetical protein